jgi:hypothetical protein
MMVADFDTCQKPNNLGGNMGAAYNLPDRLEETFVPDTGGGCYIRLEYDVVDWSAFWLELNGADINPYIQLTFDIRGDPQLGVFPEFKIELKRNCRMVTEDQRECTEFEIVYVGAVTETWQTQTVQLGAFVPTGWPGFTGLQALTDMQELVFVFEANRSGRNGVVYLDNVRFE